MSATLSLGIQLRAHDRGPCSHIVEAGEAGLVEKEGRTPCPAAAAGKGVPSTSLRISLGPLPPHLSPVFQNGQRTCFVSRALSHRALCSSWPTAAAPKAANCPLPSPDKTTQRILLDLEVRAEATTLVLLVPSVPNAAEKPKLDHLILISHIYSFWKLPA